MPSAIAQNLACDRDELLALAGHMPSDLADIIRQAPVEVAALLRTTGGMTRDEIARLCGPGEVLRIGEGIETCLAAMQATGHPARAAPSTSASRALDLPGSVHDVVVLAGGDNPGEAAARDCAARRMRQGQRVRIARPPPGLDFNDKLLGRAPGIEEGAL